MTYLLKKGELKSSTLLDRKRAKAAYQRKSTTDKKRKIAYSKLRVLLQKGGVMTMTM
jgi:hypothetical protein